VAIATPLTGDLADPEIVAAVAATAREYIACNNAGDFPRLLALISDSYLPHLLAGADLTDPAVIARLDREPEPLPATDRTVLIAVGEVRLLPDGRAAATVTGDDPTSSDPAKAPLLVFVQEGDRWLIDQIVEDEPTPAATLVP